MSKKPSHLTELDVHFSVLTLLDASLGIIELGFQCHSGPPKIYHQFWTFWVNLDRHWTSSVNISYVLSMRHCFCSKFKNFIAIFAVAHFMPKTSEKLLGRSRTTSLIVIRCLSKIIFFTDSMLFHQLLTCLGYQYKHRHWYLLGLL